MQLPTFVSTSFGYLAYEFAKVLPHIPTYTHLIVSALFPIYAGAHSSLSRPSTAAKPAKRRKKKDVSMDEEDDEPLRMEGLTPTDALMFPILAGTTLAGLYFLIQWLQDATLLNKILNWYFAGFSVFSVSRLVSDGLDVFHSLLFPHDHLDGGVLFHVDPKSKRAVSNSAGVMETRSSPLPWIFSRLPLPQFLINFFWTLHVLPNRKLTFKALIGGLGSFKLRLGIHGFEGLAIGLGSVLYYNFVDKPWWLTNLMGFGFAYGSLQLMSPTTFWTGTLILSGLFFYDIYFVFFTPMMVTVAKSLDIPIKLLFPRPPDPEADPAVKALAMLGLGDVVLPGIMIGLALRFDLHMFYLRKQRKVAEPAGLGSTSDATVEKNVEKTRSPTDDSTALNEIDSPVVTASSNKIPSTVVKAAYTSVAEGWGDRFWTYSLFPFPSPGQAYTARGVFPKPYFKASIYGYIVGMLATLAAMQASNHAQPALLYLVPGVLCSLWGTAYFKGEFQDFWMFSDAWEDEVDDKSGNGGKEAENAAKVQKDQKNSTEKGTGIFSFFGLGKERSQHPTKTMATQPESPGDKSRKNSNSKKRTHSGDDGKRAGSTLFSFSITADPSIFQKIEGDVGDRKDVAPSDDEDQTTKEDDDVPRWNSRLRSAKDQEHAGKRQRLS